MENDERIDKNGIRLRFIGRIEMFPSDIQEDMKRIMEKLKIIVNLSLILQWLILGKWKLLIQ